MDMDDEGLFGEQVKFKGFRKRWRRAEESEPSEGPLDIPHVDVHDHDQQQLFGSDDFMSTGYSADLEDWDVCDTLDDTQKVHPLADFSDLLDPGSSDPFHFASPQVIDPVKQEPQWKASAMRAEVKRVKHEIGKLPWEVDGLAFRPSDSWHGTALASFDQMFTPTCIGARDVCESQVIHARNAGTPVAMHLPVVPVSLKRSRPEPLDEDIRRRALLKLRDIVLQDPLSTQLGTSLRNRVEGGVLHDDVDQSFRDCFRMKASSTLQKRASSLNKLSKVLKAAGYLHPLRLSEAQLYEALCSMRETGCGATSAQHVLEALHFLDSTAKLTAVVLSDVISARCRGVARDMYLTKDPLQQKQPLTVEQVRRLEVTMQTAGSVLRCILGQLLFCIHACCRWKDAQRLKSVTVEKGHGETLLHADALTSKTTMSAESRTRFLPYVAIGTGVSAEDWASLWLEARREEGLAFADFVLPSFSERNACWLSSPMSASEATFWLRESLGGTEGFQPSRVGSHSCKATLLTWCGRCIKLVFSPTERRQMGHHLDPGMKSILCYSRESFTTLYAKILVMFRLIRTGEYDPDQSAISRIVQMAETSAEPQQGVGEGEPNAGVMSDSDSSIASVESLHDEIWAELEPDERAVSLFPSFPGVPESALLVHSVSALVHVVNEDDVLLLHCTGVVSMASSTLESEAAFKERATQIGVDEKYIQKFVDKRFASFGKYGFAVVYSPHHADDAPLRQFLLDLLEEEPTLDQLSCMRRLFFESHAMSLTDARQRVEAAPEPGTAVKKLATAERVARQKEQEVRLGGLVFTPETTPSNHLVDLFVEMIEIGILSYVKPEQCCSRAQEVNAIRKDPTVSTDSSGMLKLGTKVAEQSCEANTELKLRAAWRRRNLAMDLAGLVSFEVVEGWVQFLFSHLMRDQPRGFSKVSLQQLLDCDRQLFTLASHRTMGALQKGTDQVKPLDLTFTSLRESSEVLQYLIPLPAVKSHEAPAPSGSRPEKTQKTDKPLNKGGGKGAGKTAAPSKVQLPEGAEAVSQDSPPLFVEICAGRGSFSKAALQAGLRVVSIDHEVVQPFAPIVTLDLTSNGGTEILWDILKSPGLKAVHLGLPCGTSSRARELPIPKALRLAGVPEPPPLRSAAHPLGLPGLAPHHQRRVDSANVLYRLAIDIILWCHQHNVVISIENPANSWLWAVLVTLARELSTEAAYALNQLVMVQFHACCHGSTRRKHTGWLSTSGVFEPLRATCQGDHPHEPWGVKWKAGSWVFDTHAEAHYPVLLAQRATECLIRFFAAQGLQVQKPLRLHDKSLAVQGKQSRKHRPLVPEYHHIITCQVTDAQPGNSKLLSPHFQGEVEPEETNNIAVDGLGNTVKYGIYHTPKQFLSRAERVQHPMDSTEHLESATKYALDFNFRYPADVVKLERRKNLLQAKLMALKLEQDETKLHAGLPFSLQKVLAGKRLLLWKFLLEKFEYDDMGAAVGRMAMSDKAHIEHLEETAKEELQLGFLEGPFFSEAEVSAHLGRTDWSVVRRFVLVQGAEMKFRPIDDCLEAQLNHAYTVSSYLKLQDVDYIAGMALGIGERLSSGARGPGVEQWLGKCLDLSKAYKQMAVHPDHRHLSVIFYHDCNGAPKYYVANSLMFGACAAVYSFNRVSRSLWYLLNKMLAIPCGVFYDDFPMFSPESLATNADEAASSLLDLLGWRHAKTGVKASPFQPRFQVLGCALDLPEICQGSTILENKPGRVDRLVDLLQQIRADGKLTKHQGQVIHGLMRYACGFFSGKYLHQVCAEVMALSGVQTRTNSSEIVSFCDYAIHMLRTAKPRKVSAGSEKRPVLIFTDGCWEDNHAGIGAVLVDVATGQRIVCQGKVPDVLLEHWRNLVGDHLICQIELYVMVLIRWQYKDLLKSRRSIWWVDNDASRFCLIKGLSPSLSMRTLVREFYSMDAEAPSYSWIERVPSSSNISDGPSRSKCAEALQLLGLEHETAFQHPAELVG
eukprot:s2858_g15.t1